jgi:hypothetical protein
MSTLFMQMHIAVRTDGPLHPLSHELKTRRILCKGASLICLPQNSAHSPHRHSNGNERKQTYIKVWGSYSSDYEECRLLGYKNPVRTSQETYYFSVTEPSRLMPRNISSFHGGNYEEREVGGSEIHYGWGEQNLSSVLKVPRHCPFVLLVSVSI